MTEFNSASADYKPVSPEARGSVPELLNHLTTNNIQMVDLYFTDVLGKQQVHSMPARVIRETLEKRIKEGAGFSSFESEFDGSSITGFQEIHESDMIAVVDWKTAFNVPYTFHPTVGFFCNVRDPFLGDYSRDPRVIAQKAEAFLKASGIATTAYFGPEAEGFIFDEVRYAGDPEIMDPPYFLHVDSREAAWNTAREERPNLGHKIPHKGGYYPVPPQDRTKDLRAEMVLLLEAMGIPIEKSHHEVATAGQFEINMRYDSLTAMGDKLQLYRYVTKNVAEQNGRTVTFMPKPIIRNKPRAMKGDNGDGKHVHMSFWNEDNNLFADGKSGYAFLSETAQFAIGGLLAHAPAILAFAAPNINSYRRLVKGYEAPVNLAYSQRNRSAAIRLPRYKGDRYVPDAVRLEFRCPDPSSNGYLVFSAMLLAAADGIKRKISPGDPLDKDIYQLSPPERAKIKSTPGKLEEVLEALERDHQFLTENGVFLQPFLEKYIEIKRKELDLWNLGKKKVLRHLRIKKGQKMTPRQQEAFDNQMLGVEAYLTYSA